MQMKQMLVGRLDNILDTEVSWHMFMADAVGSHGESKNRYQRINPVVGSKVPALDEVSKLSELQDAVRQNLSKDRTSISSIKEIAHRLIASTFYFEKDPFSVNPGNHERYCSGTTSLC